MPEFKHFSKPLLLLRCDLYGDAIKDLEKFAMEFESVEEHIEIYDHLTVLKNKLDKLRNS